MCWGHSREPPALHWEVKGSSRKDNTSAGLAVGVVCARRREGTPEQREMRLGTGWGNGVPEQMSMKAGRVSRLVLGLQSVNLLFSVIVKADDDGKQDP